MNIHLHNAKAEASLQSMNFFDNNAEWQAYLKENPDKEKLMLASPEDRFKDGKSAIDCFREAVEYIPRSLIGRPLQTYLARNLICLLTQEKKNRVLDYGCGAGNMSFLFAQAGFHVDALDVEGEITDFLKWRVQRHFQRINVLNEVTELKKYDLVMLFNVLEHLMNPMWVLERITESLETGGILAMLFNTHGHGLDIVTWEQWESELKPYLLANFDIMQDTDGMIFRKK